MSTRRDTLTDYLLSDRLSLALAYLTGRAEQAGHQKYAGRPIPAMSRRKATLADMLRASIAELSDALRELEELP